jgi:molybdopterin synthase sulfur carrier subunit
MRDSASATHTVNVVYLARLREAFERGAETLPLPADVDPITVADILATLTARGGVWAAELAPGRAVRVAVNYAMTSREAPVQPGDEVALFPPVTGG